MLVHLITEVLTKAEYERDDKPVMICLNPFVKLFGYAGDLKQQRYRLANCADVNGIPYHQGQYENDGHVKVDGVMRKVHNEYAQSLNAKKEHLLFMEAKNVQLLAIKVATVASLYLAARIFHILNHDHQHLQRKFLASEQNFESHRQQTKKDLDFVKEKVRIFVNFL